MRWIGHDMDGSGPSGISPSGHTMDGITHNFAKTTGAPSHMEDGSTGVKHWIQGVVNSQGFHKGALTKQAHSAGETPMQLARQHQHDSGKTGARARFAVNVNK